MRSAAPQSLPSPDVITQNEKSLCVAAAMSATEAATELLRFVREGEGLNGMFEIDDLVEKLLDAAKMTIDAMGNREEAVRYVDIHRDLKHELTAWI
jgi:hypothetical protein